MILNEFFNNNQFENKSFGNPEPEQQQMDADRRGRLGRERNAGLDEPDDAVSGSVQTGNGVYEYNVPAGQESTAQELGLQQHRGHWVSRVPIQRANFQFGRPQFHEIPSPGVAEGVRDLGYDAQSLIMKLRRDVEEKRLQPTPQAVLAAARELAGDMDFAPQLLVKQVLGQGVAEGMEGRVVFSGTGANGSKYEIIQTGPTDFMIHANGRHIDTYSSLQRAMGVLKNEVPGLQQGVAEAQLDEKWSTKYKDSINCSNPKGFSQRAHCQGKNK